MAVAVAGASVFVFLIKGGTVALLVRAEREAVDVEEPPLQAARVATAAVFSIERFIEASRTLFPRFVRLGCALMVVYALSGLAVLATAFREGASGLLVTAAAIIVFVLWITAVNLLYLLAQIVMASEGCGAGVAVRRAVGFVRRVPRTVLGVCAVSVGLVVLVTAASFVAATALGLIGFVPFVGLAVLPLQLLAWLLRGAGDAVRLAGLRRRVLGALPGIRDRRHPCCGSGGGADDGGGGGLSAAWVTTT